MVNDWGIIGYCHAKDQDDDLFAIRILPFKTAKLGYEAVRLCVVPTKIWQLWWYIAEITHQYAPCIVVPETLGFEAVNACRRVKGIGRMGTVSVIVVRKYIILYRVHFILLENLYRGCPLYSRWYMVCSTHTHTDKWRRFYFFIMPALQTKTLCLHEIYSHSSNIYSRLPHDHRPQ